MKKTKKTIYAADGVYGTKKGYSRDPDAITFGEGSDPAKARLSKSRRRFQTGATPEQIEAGKMRLDKKVEKAVIKPSGVSKAKMAAAMKKIKKANAKKAAAAIKSNEKTRQEVLKAKPKSTGPRTIVEKPKLGAMGREYSSALDKQKQIIEKEAQDRDDRRKANVLKSIEANKKSKAKKTKGGPRMGVNPKDMTIKGGSGPRGKFLKRINMGGVIMKNRGGMFKGTY